MGRLARVTAVHLVACSPPFVAGVLAALVFVGSIPGPFAVLMLVMLALYPPVSSAAVRALLTTDDRRRLAELVGTGGDDEGC